MGLGRCNLGLGPGILEPYSLDLGLCNFGLEPYNLQVWSRAL